MIISEAIVPMKGIASMDELSLFSLALGLTKPWKVAEIKFSKEEGRLDLWPTSPKARSSPVPRVPTRLKARSTTPRTGRGDISTSFNTRPISMPGFRGSAAGRAASSRSRSPGLGREAASRCSSSFSSCPCRGRCRLRPLQS